MMNTQINPDVYKSCERAFLREVAKTLTVVVGRTASMSPDEKAKLVSLLTFAVAAHLSGSSFGGEVAGDEIYPKLGFWKGESDDTLYFGNGCMLHGLVPSVLDELAAERKVRKTD